MNASVDRTGSSLVGHGLLKLWESYSLVFVTLGLVILLSFLTPRFLSFSNILNIITQSSFNAIIAAGATFVILTGGIDLSVGSIVAFTSCLSADLLMKSFPPVFAVLAGIFIGCVMGLVNGGLVSVLNVPPFIATLGMMGIGRGAALVYTEGRPISRLPDSFVTIFSGKILGVVPIAIPLMFLVYFVSYLVLKYSVFGLNIYATGGNEPTAFLSGVRTRLVKCYVYIVSGGLAALSGLLLTARLNSAQPVLGIGYELDAIGAVVIGGTSLFGGEGKIVGSLVGALAMGVIRNGLNLLNVTSYWQQIVIGLVLIIAVALSVFRFRGRRG